MRCREVPGGDATEERGAALGRKVLIIGAGIAGLSAGCYLQMNGYDTEIFELHTIPGGVCTSWKRKGYTFDGCAHWVIGTKEGSGYNRVWRELGALPGPGIVRHEEFRRVEGPDGRELVVYLDPDRLERHLKELCRVDDASVELLAGSLRKLGGVSLPLWPPAGWSEMLDVMKMIPTFARLARVAFKVRKISIGRFVERLEDPFLRETFGQLALLVKPGSSISEDPEYGLFGVLTALAVNREDSGYPVGGSLEFARGIERRYLALGGRVNYRSRVAEITTSDDRATGVRLDDGTEHRGDIVISAADGRSTIFDMLGGSYISDEIRHRFNTWSLYPPLVQVSIGAAIDLSGEPHLLQFALDSPLDAGGYSQSSLLYSVYSYDPTMAPAGKSVVILTLTSDYDHWKRLSADREAYLAEKKRIADQVIDIFEARWTGFREAVEVVDVATPLTWERYTANWRGSYEGWLPDRQSTRYMLTGLKKTLPGLRDFYMIGQWVQPGGGLPIAAAHGRQVARLICRKDRRRFKTATAP